MLTNSLLLFLAVTLPAISPSGVVSAISNALRYGRPAVHYSALGNALGLTILGFAVAFGLAAVLAVSAAAFTVVKIIGAAYSSYWAQKVLRDGQGHRPSTGGASQAHEWGAPLPPGIFDLMNPKALVLIAALIPPFVDRGSRRSHRSRSCPSVTRRYALPTT